MFFSLCVVTILYISQQHTAPTLHQRCTLPVTVTRKKHVGVEFAQKYGCSANAQVVGETNPLCYAQTN